MSEKKGRITLYLTKITKQRLTALAKSNQRSVNDFINTLIINSDRAETKLTSNPREAVSSSFKSNKYKL